LEDLFGWMIPSDTPPMVLEEYLGDNSVWKDRFLRESNNEVPPDKTVGGQIKAFLDREVLRVLTGDITAKRYDNLTHIFRIIETQLGSGRDVSSINEQAVNHFHGFLLRELIKRNNSVDGKEGFSEAYASAILGRFKSFVSYLHCNRIINDLPRNLDKVSIKVMDKPIRTMTVDEVKNIINGIPEDNQLKLHVLLMLNCGYRGMDIATLRQSELRDGRIIRKRHKTKDLKDTPIVNYKLWGETFRLLERWNSQQETVLLTKSGSRWVYSDLIEQPDGSHKTKQTDNIATVYNRIVRDPEKGLGIDHPYSLFRKTGASMLDNHPEFGRYAEHYLGEKPSSVAKKHYVTPGQDRFDATIEWLGEQYGIS
jgi:integrase